MALSEDENCDNIDDIMDSLANDLDAIGYMQREAIDMCLRKLRPLDRNCANELERVLYELEKDGRVGLSQSSYVKAKAIRPIQKTFRKNKH